MNSMRFRKDTVEGLRAFYKAKRDQAHRIWEKNNARDKVEGTMATAQAAGIKLASQTVKLPKWDAYITAGDRMKVGVMAALREIGEGARVCDATIYFQAPGQDFDGNYDMQDAALQAMPWGIGDSESGQGFFYVPAARAEEALKWFEENGAQATVSVTTEADDGYPTLVFLKFD